MAARTLFYIQTPVSALKLVQEIYQTSPSQSQENNAFCKEHKSESLKTEIYLKQENLNHCAI